MNILMVTPYFYPEGGGLERYAYSISKLLVEQGHRVIVVCTGKKRAGMEEIGGIRIIRVKPWFLISNTPVAPALYVQALQVIEQNDIDIVHAHTPVPFAVEMAVLVSKKTKKHLIITYHSSGVYAPSIFLRVAWMLYEPVEKWSLKHAQQVTTPSKSASSNLKRTHHVLSKTIPPGVWATHEHYGYAPNVLFVGQLDRAHRWKGLEVLIRAVAKLKNMKRLTLTIVGDGDYRHYYQQLAAECNISDIVVFKGRISSKHLLEEYKRAGVVVLPSTSSAESFGMVLIEAMSCATPVIGSSIGGIPDVITHCVTGLLVPPEEVALLSDALRQVLSDKDLAQRLGEAGRSEVRTKYLWSNTTNQLLKVYRDVLNG